MNKHSVFRYFIFLILPALILTVACEIKVPIKQMSLARLTITRCGEVKADKYAPEEVKKAKEYLLKCHESIKAEKIDKAEEEANKALEFANKAVEKSLPLLSKDSLDEAKKIYEEADLLNSEKYASEDFNTASSGIKEAETLHEGSKFWESYLKSQEVIKASTDARTKSVDHVSEVKAEISSKKSEAENLRSAGGDQYAAEDINGAVSKLDSAMEDAEKSNLKDASAKITEADGLLSEAKGKIATVKIAEAEKGLQEAEASKMKDEFKSDIDNASSLVAESKRLHENKSYGESLAKVDEALKVLENLNNSLNQKYADMKKTASEKIESAENSLNKIKESPLRKYFEEDIAKVGPLIEESKELNRNESYKESIDKSDEALDILNTINIAMEKKAEEMRLSKEKQAAGEEYVVKYNPKKRDCLWRIAYYVYKDAKLWPLIYMANKESIKDPDLIFPGQKFVIPPVPQKGEKVVNKEDEAKKDDTAESSDNE